MLPPLHYTYTLSSTQATTGYFSCEPEPPLTFFAALERLEAAPMDVFLHRALLRDCMNLPAMERHALSIRTAQSPAIAALMQECAVLRNDTTLYNAAIAQAVMDASPLPLLRNHIQPDAELHRVWSQLFAHNIMQHRALPHPDEGEPPHIYAAYSQDTQATVPHIGALRAHMLRQAASPEERPPAHETAARALDVLTKHGIIAGVEMRHEASLSPIALQRDWQLHISVSCGAVAHTLKGIATSYGRGLSIAAARASYAMEMVERASAYAHVRDTAIIGTEQPMPLLRARFSEVHERACDPNTLPLDAPYADQPLYWLNAIEAGTGATVLVPAQSVYLFCNLDEPALCEAPTSTGLASGNTLAEAKVAALLECIERDAEAIIPYDRRRCFAVRSEDPRLQALLDDYTARNVHVQCMDLTSAFGVPCYQCFVVGQGGDVRRATGAHLHGASALLSALTEVPWPYPHGPASAPPLPHVPIRALESLPDYRMESPARNVALLEAVLATHGHRPLYVDMSRADLGLPVLRALIPGLEQNPEPDARVRISRRRFCSYLVACDA